MNFAVSQRSIRLAIRQLIVVFGIFGAVAAPSSATESRTLALEESGNGRLMISTTINGQFAKALIDTGATIPLIDHAHFEADAQSWDKMPQADILGVGGRRNYPLTTLNELKIGTDRWSNLKVAINRENRLPAAQSILPLNLFRYRVVDFDFADQKLHLYDDRPRHVTNAVRSKLKYEMVNGLMFVNVSINGVSGKALIDTGSDVTFTTPSYSQAAKGRIDEDETQRIRGSDLSASTAEIHRFRDFRIGKSKLAKVQLPVLDTELFQTLGIRDKYGMVIGMDFLQHFRMQIDREKQEIRFLRLPVAQASYIQRGNPAMSLRSIRRR